MKKINGFVSKMNCRKDFPKQNNFSKNEENVSFQYPTILRVQIKSFFSIASNENLKRNYSLKRILNHIKNENN